VSGEARAYPVDTNPETESDSGPAGRKPGAVGGRTGRKIAVRAFRSRLDGSEGRVFRKNGSSDFLLVDSADASEWNFKGCAVREAPRKCLEALPASKDYWFDWRNYHPDTTVYRR